MPYFPATPDGFWDTIADHVTDKVRPVLQEQRSAQAPVIAYLRELEGVARRECESRAAIQVIASGRHVLGDRSEIGPPDGPFSRT